MTHARGNDFSLIVAHIKRYKAVNFGGWVWCLILREDLIEILINRRIFMEEFSIIADIIDVEYLHVASRVLSQSIILSVLRLITR